MKADRYVMKQLSAETERSENVDCTWSWQHGSSAM